jgi:hypothetical protein
MAWRPPIPGIPVGYRTPSPLGIMPTNLATDWVLSREDTVRLCSESA